MRFLVWSLLFGVCISTQAFGQDVQIVCHWGVDGKNKLDTKTGVYEHDMVIGDPEYTTIRFTDEENTQVMKVADSIGFFQMPHDVPYVPRRVDSTLIGFDMVQPCGTYFIKIVTETDSNWVAWNDCIEPLVERSEALDILLASVIRIVMDRPEYKALPRPRGAYQ